jgi:hypothetical protein
MNNVRQEKHHFNIIIKKLKEIFSKHNGAKENNNIGFVKSQLKTTCKTINISKNFISDNYCFFSISQ